MKIVKWLFVMILLAAAWVGGYGYGRWYGPKSTPAPAKTERKILYWIDPMHPSYKSDKPGVAPDCNMQLEPVYADQAPAQLPPGTLEISPEKQQLIGVRYGVVERAGGVETIRAVGRVAMDERRVANVHTKVDGWIEKVFVDFTGKLVEKGQPLLTVYSPEMLATQQEFLLAVRGRHALEHSVLGESRDHAAALVEAARRRLELWDLSPAQIDEIARTRQPIRAFTVYAPASGFVTERMAFPNQRVMPETKLYTITDLSRVWILADVFEYEAHRVRLGQVATVRLPYGSGRAFAARVEYILPQVDPQTRTLKVRLEADNPGFALKPDMFVDVEFRLYQAARLSVPAEAVLDSGQRKTVFVETGSGLLEARQVETGERIGDRIEIRGGLKAGERVVSSGNFLIDSESQLRAAISGMSAGAAGHQHGAAPAPASHPREPAKPSPSPKPQGREGPQGHQHD